MHKTLHIAHSITGDEANNAANDVENTRIDNAMHADKWQMSLEIGKCAARDKETRKKTNEIAQRKKRSAAKIGIGKWKIHFQVGI